MNIELYHCCSGDMIQCIYEISERILAYRIWDNNALELASEKVSGLYLLALFTHSMLVYAGRQQNVSLYTLDTDPASEIIPYFVIAMYLYQYPYAEHGTIRIVAKKRAGM